VVKFSEFEVNHTELIEELQECKKLVFCSHDAGGAELLSSFIAANKLTGKFLLSGPAIKIFHSKNLLSDENQITTFEAETLILLSSTGTTDFEYSSMLIARQLDARVFVILDHWMNYTERFERRGGEVSPDLILVVDEYAFDIAKRKFPLNKIILTKNYFLENIKRDFRNFNKTAIEFDYVFVCESRSKDSTIQLDSESDNLQGIEYFFDYLSSIGENNSRILVRPHPSDLDKDYMSTVPKSFPGVTISSKQSLLEVLRISDVIVGCNSMALVIADAVGKTVFTAVKAPNECYLPIRSIRLLSEMKN
jgi:hypothetical protein